MTYLLELRKRLLFCFLMTAVLFCCLCLFANPIFDLLTKPLLRQLPSSYLIATKITTPFMAPLKFVFILSLLLLVPLFFYQLWAFISPALYRKERKTIWYLLLPSVLLFYLGVLFAYLVVLPLIFNFFIKTTPSSVKLLPDIAQYLDFAMQLLLAFGLSFEVPIVVLLLVLLDLYTVAELRAARRYVIVLAFVIAMLLTPPDIFSQIGLAVPMCLLYELGLFLATRVNLTK